MKTRCLRVGKVRGPTRSPPPSPPLPPPLPPPPPLPAAIRLEGSIPAGPASRPTCGGEIGGQREPSAACACSSNAAARRRCLRRQRCGLGVGFARGARRRGAPVEAASRRRPLLHSRTRMAALSMLSRTVQVGACALMTRHRTRCRRRSAEWVSQEASMYLSTWRLPRYLLTRPKPRHGPCRHRWRAGAHPLTSPQRRWPRHHVGPDPRTLPACCCFHRRLRCQNPPAAYRSR